MPDSGKTLPPSDKADKPKVRRNRPPRKKLDFSATHIKLWFREMRSELKKVVWPTPRQVLNNSIIVAVAVVVVGVLITLYDSGLETLIKFVILSFNPTNSNIAGAAS